MQCASNHSAGAGRSAVQASGDFGSSAPRMPAPFRESRASSTQAELCWVVFRALPLKTERKQTNISLVTDLARALPTVCST